MAKSLLMFTSVLLINGAFKKPCSVCLVSYKWCDARVLDILSCRFWRHFFVQISFIFSADPIIKMSTSSKNFMKKGEMSWDVSNTKSNDFSETTNKIINCILKFFFYLGNSIIYSIDDNVAQPRKFVHLIENHDIGFCSMYSIQQF